MKNKFPTVPAFKDLTVFSGAEGFPGDSDGEESACNAGDPGLIPGSGRYSGDVHGNPLQYAYLENSMDRGSMGL